jgi:hypothetical protein
MKTDHVTNDGGNERKANRTKEEEGNRFCLQILVFFSKRSGRKIK